MADKKVNIKINADSSNAEQGLNRLTSKVNQFGKNLSKNQSLSGFSKLGMSLKALLGPISLVTVGLTSAVKVIKDLNSAALKQIKAEKQLEQAARNNPYLNKQSVAELKEFASQLQKIGSYGDEELIPMMAQLASAGRDQSQIQAIMKAALDASASGAVSMEQAVAMLNKSLNGEAGELSKLASEVKNLTKEELSEGKAIEIIAAQYNGMSEAATKATGSGEQLAMSFGDLKEAIGMGWAVIIAPIQRFLTATIDKCVQVVTWFNKLLGITKTANIKPSDETKSQLEAIQANLKANEEKLKKIQEQEKNSAKNIAESAYNTQAETEKRISELRAKSSKERTKEEKKELQELLRLRRQMKDNAEEEEYLGMNAGTSSSTYDNSEEIAALEKTIAEQKAKQFELEKKYNSELEKEKIIVEDTKEAEEEKLDDTLLNKWLSNSKTEVEQLKEELELLLERKNLLEGKGLDTAAVEHAIQNCTDALETAKVDEFYGKIQNVLGQVSNISNQLASGIQNSVSLARQSIETQTNYQISALERQYEQGLITEENYQKQKADIEEKAAEETYKLDMWNWSSQILQATASTALAVVNALATSKNIYAGIAMAGLAATMGGVQIGTLMANKPVKPNFATGGIVGGSSYSGDNVQANVNSGEMILNAKQQLQLWKSANGTGLGGNVTVNIPIENTASDVVAVQKVSTNEGYKILIKKVVNEGLYDGSFNNGLKKAQSSFNGINYTN